MTAAADSFLQPDVVPFQTKESHPELRQEIRRLIEVAVRHHNEWDAVRTAQFKKTAADASRAAESAQPKKDKLESCVRELRRYA